MFIEQNDLNCFFKSGFAATNARLEQRGRQGLAR